MPLPQTALNNPRERVHGSLAASGRATPVIASALMGGTRGTHSVTVGEGVVWSPSRQIANVGRIPLAAGNPSIFAGIVFSAPGMPASGRWQVGNEVPILQAGDIDVNVVAAGVTANGPVYMGTDNGLEWADADDSGNRFKIVNAQWVTGGTGVQTLRLDGPIFVVEA